MTNDETRISRTSGRVTAGQLFRHSDFGIRHCFVVRDFVIRYSLCRSACLYSLEQERMVGSVVPVIGRDKLIQGVARML